MQTGEQVISDIRRHPIGLLIVYLFAGLFLLLMAGIAFVIIPGATDSGSQVTGIATAVFVFMTALTLIFVFLYNVIYWDNHLILTSDSITEVSRSGLFNKQSSQLSLGNLEDVTAAEKGILQSIFNFGSLTVETAGEHIRFFFPYCPRPEYYAKQILAARETFEQGHRGGKQPRPDLPQPPSEPENTVDSYEVPS